MKKFKLNAFEKFVIRHKKLTVILSFVATTVTTSIISIIKGGVTVPTDTFFPSVPWMAVILYAFFLPIYINQKAVQAFHNLEIDYALDGICKLADAANPKDILVAPLYHNNKAYFLMVTGKNEEALEEMKSFFRIFDTRKLSSVILLMIHANYALLKIRENDEKGYNEQLKIVQGYYDKVRKTKLNPDIRNADLALTELLNASAAHFEPYSEDFEQKILYQIEFFGGKRKKKITPYDYLSAYSLLFDYFVRFENTEKALYYAHKITEIGNSGFLAYRIAKEYLENADKCN